MSAVRKFVRIKANEEFTRGHKWQRRFWEHAIRDERDYVNHIDYVHVNPLKHGYVTRVKDWPYSPFHRYVREGVLPADWGGDYAFDAATDFGERPFGG